MTRLHKIYPNNYVKKEQTLHVWTNLSKYGGNYLISIWRQCVKSCHKLVQENLHLPKFNFKPIIQDHLHYFQWPGVGSEEGGGEGGGGGSVCFMKYPVIVWRVYTTASRYYLCIVNPQNGSAYILLLYHYFQSPE